MTLWSAMFFRESTHQRDEVIVTHYPHNVVVLHTLLSIYITCVTSLLAARQPNVTWLIINPCPRVQATTKILHVTCDQNMCGIHKSYLVHAITHVDFPAGTLLCSVHRCCGNVLLANLDFCNSNSTFDVGNAIYYWPTAVYVFCKAIMPCKPSQ